MLTKLLPDQISKFWPIVKYAVEQSLPPVVGEHPDKMNRILSSALCNHIDVWVSYTKGEDNKFEGIVLTEILYDEASGTKNLLIYCLYGYDLVSNESWMQGLVNLVKYAKAKQCNQIVAYTKEEVIIKLVKRLGGETDYTFISFDVDKIIKSLNDLNGG